MQMLNVKSRQHFEDSLSQLVSNFKRKLIMFGFTNLINNHHENIDSHNGQEKSATFVKMIKGIRKVSYIWTNISFHTIINISYNNLQEEKKRANVNVNIVTKIVMDFELVI